MTQIFGWWTGSAMQVGIVVSIFWLALIVAILALVGANRRCDDLDDEEIEDPMPEPLSHVTAAHADVHRGDVRKVRGLS